MKITTEMRERAEQRFGGIAEDIQLHQVSKPDNGVVTFEMTLTLSRSEQFRITEDVMNGTSNSYESVIEYTMNKLCNPIEKMVIGRKRPQEEQRRLPWGIQAELSKNVADDVVITKPRTYYKLQAVLTGTPPETEEITIDTRILELKRTNGIVNMGIAAARKNRWSEKEMLIRMVLTLVDANKAQFDAAVRSSQRGYA